MSEIRDDQKFEIEETPHVKYHCPQMLGLPMIAAVRPSTVDLATPFQSAQQNHISACPTCTSNMDNRHTQELLYKHGNSELGTQ